MWVLLVLSLMHEDDIKFTEYDRFDDQISCVIGKIQLEDSFTNNEKAICMLNYHAPDNIKVKSTW